MTTSRRALLSLIGATAAAAVLDPDRLLWVPGAKTISIPKPQAYRAGDVFRYAGVLPADYAIGVFRDGVPQHWEILTNGDSIHAGDHLFMLPRGVDIHPDGSIFISFQPPISVPNPRTAVKLGGFV